VQGVPAQPTSSAETDGADTDYSGTAGSAELADRVAVDDTDADKL
jgi:hypothetical protein